MNRLSVWEKGEKNHEEKGKGWEPAAISPSCLCLVIADHLSARLLSVTSIHWNAINFVCKKGVGRQHATFTSCQKYCLFRWVFSLAGRLCPGGLSFDWKNVIFAAYFKLRGRDTHTDFFFYYYFVYGLSPFPSRFFHPFPKQRACSRARSQMVKAICALS